MIDAAALKSRAPIDTAMTQGYFMAEEHGYSRNCNGPPHGEVRLAFSEIFRVAGVGAYHTSITFGGMEYSFNRKGIECRPPFASHTFARRGSRLEIQRFGKTTVTHHVFMESLAPLFEAGTYDVLYKNCNAFSDTALYFLFRERLDPQYSRVERLLTAAGPFFTSGVINGVSAAAGLLDVGTGRYIVNPRAINFCLEDAIVACDSMHVAHLHSSPSSVGRTTLCCCVGEDEAHGTEHIQAVEMMQTVSSDVTKLRKVRSSREGRRPLSVPPRFRPQIITCDSHKQRHRRRQCLI